MKVSTKRMLTQLAFFIMFNAAFLGVPLLPVLVPVLECFSMPYKTTLCNFGILQRNLSFDWQVVPVLPLASLGMFVIVGVFVGRAMCGWACPLGFFQDASSSVLRFLKVRQKELTRKLHYMLSSVKYMILFVTAVIVIAVGAMYVLNTLLGRKFAFSLGICGRAPYCLICPVPVLFVTLPSLVSASFLGTPFPELPLTFYIGFGVLVFFLVSSLLTKRFWCRYICPLGALMGFFNKVSLLRISKKSNKCTTFCRGHQKKCNETCSMGMQVSRNQEPSSSSDCIFCYECGESCANSAVRYDTC